MISRASALVLAFAMLDGRASAQDAGPHLEPALGAAHLESP